MISASAESCAEAGKVCPLQHLQELSVAFTALQILLILLLLGGVGVTVGLVVGVVVVTAATFEGDFSKQHGFSETKMCLYVSIFSISGTI